MITLARQDDPRAARQVVAVFGVGLVGTALVGALRRRGPWHAQRHEVSWADPARLAAELPRIEGALAGAGRLHVVWSAGRAGFAATEAETEAEGRTYRAVLATAERLAVRRPGAHVAFHLVSSTGGLFEGQRHVDHQSVPAPRRPYGELKLRQECWLAGAAPRLVKRVYRLTSVYGPAHGRGRRGLITTLIVNGLRQRASSITGRSTTLRDFTWVGDVAQFLAGDLLGSESPGASATYTLASGVPASILEVRRVVEGVLGRPLYLSYSSAPANGEDITFSSKVRPPGWSASDLKTNVKAVYCEAVREGFVHEHDRAL